MAHRQVASTASRRRFRLLIAAVVVAIVAVALGTSSRGKGWSRSVVAAPGREPAGAIEWPADGVSAAEVGDGGLLRGPGADRPVPIASVAKVMTAYVVLHDHPLVGDEQGPQIVVAPSEAAAYPAQVRAGDSVVRVQAGEVLSEREALQALLLPSADNIAWILARWDAGSIGAFVDRMNAAAHRLGMDATHYTDPSGLASSTTSSAADQVRLGVAAMAQPGLAAIVDESTAVIPVAGTVENLNALLGEDGIVGLKTGSTTAAGGCVLLAARSSVGAHSLLIVAAVFGQPGSPDTILPAALRAGLQLVSSLQAHRAGAGRP